MPSVCFCFEVHQPCRLRPYGFFDMGARKDYEDRELNRSIIRKVAETCYLPMNALLLELIERHQGRLRLSFSLSGTVIDQLEAYAPEALEGFKALARTGCVEFLDEPDNHGLAFLFSEDEFRATVRRHRERMYRLFGQQSRAFHNTELIYNNDVAQMAEHMGYSVILSESPGYMLGWRSPHFVYRPQSCPGMKLMLKSSSLSDDIARRFSDRSWVSYPLMADTFASWLHRVKGNGEVINLFMNYETFGEHQGADTGIFDFMRALPDQILKDPEFNFLTVSEAAGRYGSYAALDVPYHVSQEGALYPWLGNDMQKDAFRALCECQGLVNYLDDEELTGIWRKLQTADHLYYMSTPRTSGGRAHPALSPYRTPLEAYTNFMNILADLRIRLVAKSNQ